MSLCIINRGCKQNAGLWKQARIIVIVIIIVIAVPQSNILPTGGDEVPKNSLTKDIANGPIKMLVIVSSTKTISASNSGIVI